jgi:O-antigen/teichoic acid export membrane protein
VAAGDVGSKLLAFAATTLMVRLATPAQMATLSLFVTLQTVLLQLTDLGLGVSMVRHLAGQRAEPETERAFVRTVLIARLLLMGVVGIPVVTLGPWLLTHVLHRPLFLEPLYFATLSIVGGGLLALAISYLQARRRFLALSLLRMGEGGGKLLLLAGLVLFIGFSVRGVLWIQVLVLLLLGIAGLFLLPARVLGGGSSRAEVHGLFVLSSWILLATLVHMIAFQLDTLMLGLLSTPEELGIYGAGLRLSSPLQMLAGILGTVFLPEAMQHREPAAARRFLLRSLRATVPLGLIGLLGAAAVSLPLPHFFPQYVGLRPVFLLLCLGLGSYALIAAGQGIVIARERTHWVAAVAIGQLMCNAAGNALLIPRLGARGAALATGVTWVLSTATYAALAWRVTCSRRSDPTPTKA